MIGLRRVTIVSLLVVFVTAGVLGPAAQSTAQSAKPEGEMRWALYVSLVPAWFDPGDVVGRPHAVLGALRPARRAGQADAGQPSHPEPGRVLDGQP